MTVEVATFIADLQPVNPPSVDPVSQGDDHLRLLKQVLQNTFPGISKAWYVPTTTAKSADFTVVATDQNKTFLVDTTSSLVNMTLPSLAAGDAGWQCFHIKTTAGVNPVMVKPPSGTLASGALFALAAARRSIPGARITSFWTGTAWYISRAENAGGPVGTCIEYHGSSLPFGFEWPSGQTLASVATAYPEYNAVIGSGITLDKRGRASLALDNLGGSAAGRLAGGFITGTAIGNTGGLDGVTLSSAQIPAHSHANTLTDNGHTHTGSGTSGTVGLGPGGGASTFGPGGFASTAVAITITTGGPSTAPMTITNVNNVGGGGSHSNLQPSIMVGQLLVVE